MDYAAAPIQPIVQGLLTVALVNGTPTPTFMGRGVSNVVRGVTVAVPPVISYFLTLDKGLPGNAGELQQGPVPVVGPQPDARTLVNIRGSTSALASVPGGTSISGIGVSYLPGASTDNANQIVSLVFTNEIGVTVDPMDTVASGVEIIVWKGL